MRLRPRTLLIVGALIALAVLAQRALFQERAIPVETAAVSIGPVEEVVTNSEAGTAKAKDRAVLSVERAGRVASIPYREGTRARAGAVLLTLDTATETNRLEAARRDFESARAAREAAHAATVLAAQSYDRVSALERQGLTAKEQLDQARSRRDAAVAEERAAAARVKSAAAAVAIARDEISHVQVRAPFDGVVAKRSVEVGESVIPGQALLELVGDRQLFVSAPIDERDAGRLEEGLPARVTVDAYPGVTWTGVVTRVAPVVEELKQQSRTLEVEVALPTDPAKPRVRPGMTADVEVILARRDGVVRVPTLAIVEGKALYVVVKGRAERREITAGVRNWEWTEVRSGVRAGERIVTSLDRAGLKPGARVAAASPGKKP
ncbi:MAG TPA: efflux RND transporter periplasmic adaptor subunit [Candidatus Eisenbacteria bacterium]|nr:efflux RND transporter periplasmic adaptor subunit [Candidatus Eisenbacteria bacterium]